MSVSIDRIHECVVFSRRKLERLRKERLAAVQKFVGNHYADNGSKRTMPVNLLEMAVTIYLRLLAARAPKCSVSTDDATLRPFAADMEIVLNQLPGEIGMEQTMRLAVMEAMFSIGVVKVGISGADPRPNIGDEPFASLVQIDDYFCDMSAKSWNEIQYEGNDYWMSRDAIREFFGEDLVGDEYNGTDDTGVEQARSVGNDEPGGELSERVQLRDVYIVGENRMVTYEVKTLRVLRDEPWDGPEGSPYVKLTFSEVPGNLMPLSPVALWQDLNDLVNTLFRKLSKQAISRKTVAVFAGGSDEDAQRFCGAADGDAIRGSGNDPHEVSVGGIDQTNLAFAIQVRDLYSVLAGNLDSLGGLSPQSDTATQDKLINEAASARVKNMGDRVVEFAKSIFRRLAWYVWTDPVRERKYRKVASREFNIGVDKKWTPETRDGDFLDYNFRVSAFSMQDDSPSARLEKLSSVFQQFVIPFAGDLANQGLYVNIRAVLDYVGRNANLPELSDFVAAMEEREPPEPGRAASLPQPSYVSRKPAVTRRVYERVNRPGSMSERGKNAVLSQLLLGGRPQKADLAGLSEGRVA